MEEGRSSLKSLTYKREGKIPLGRPRRRWEDNIRINLKEIGINTRNYVNRNFWRALVSAELNLRFHNPLS